MICKSALILCVAYSIIAPGCLKRPANDLGLATQAESPTIKVTATDCLPESQLSDVFQRLTFGKSQLEADQAQEVLVSDSRKSPKCRKRVIAVIMRALDKPNLDLSSDPSMYEVWHYGGKLLGDLKGIEALDLLISPLRSSSGFVQHNNVTATGFAGSYKDGTDCYPKAD